MRAMNELDTRSFAARYRLGAADTRMSVLWAVRDGAPALVGLGLLVALCATTSVFGTAGTVALAAVPALVGWRLLGIYRRAQAAIRGFGDAEIDATFQASGLRLETPTQKTEIAWAGLRRIVRRPGGWVFTTRLRSRFFIPERAIPVEARALIARWAAAAKVRLE
jgi:hypothetical protein